MTFTLLELYSSEPHTESMLVRNLKASPTRSFSFKVTGWILAHFDLKRIKNLTLVSYAKFVVDAI